MDKKKVKHKEDYSLRTLAYYQREGGVYNDLITILQRIRVGKVGGSVLPPNQILNAATDAFDAYIELCEDDDTNAIIDCGFEEFSGYIHDRTMHVPLGGWFMHTSLAGWHNKNGLIVLCALCVLLSRYPEFNELSVPQISDYVRKYDLSYRRKKDESLFEKFGNLVKENTENKDAQLEALKKLLSIYETTIADKDLQIAKQSSLIADLEQRVEKYESVQQRLLGMELTDDDVRIARNYLMSTSSSEFDKHLTVASILNWIGKRKHYKLADQVLTMLKDIGRKTATDEEYEQIEAIENELISKYSELSIVNNNMGIGSNILTGLTQNPMMPMGITPDQLVQKFLEFINNGARRENKD